MLACLLVHAPPDVDEPAQREEEHRQRAPGIHQNRHAYMSAESTNVATGLEDGSAFSDGEIPPTNGTQIRGIKTNRNAGVIFQRRNRLRTSA